MHLLRSISRASLVLIAFAASQAALAANRPAGYVTICTENKTCSVAATTNVAFGRADKFFYKSLTGSFVCNAATFGGRTGGGVNECSAPSTNASSSKSSVASSVTSSSVASSSSSRASSSLAPSSSSSSVASSSIASSSVASSVPPLQTGLVGFATLNRDGQNGTTGGAGGSTVTVTSFTALRDAIADNTARIIYVSGTINSEGGVKMINVGSNKSILGIGSTSKIVGFGLDVSGWTAAIRAANGGGECTPDKLANFTPVKNVIIRNIAFEAPTDDSIQVSCYSRHVWIDHNSFTKGYDGSVDIKRGSDWVTVSWNHFIKTDKTMLLGHDDNNAAQDTGKLHVTYHHNFLDNSTQRNPRVRFGQAHVYNNYGNHISSYMIGLGVGCDVYAEGNYLLFADAVTDDFGGSIFTWAASNIVVDTDHPAVSKSAAFNPSSYYSYSPDAAANIPTIVQQGAGVGKIVP